MGISHIYETHWIQLIYKDNEMKSPCPKKHKFFFILILFIKRKKFDNPKVQFSSKPKTIFSIHPVSRRNRAKFFPCEIKINKKSRVLERRFLETWVAQPEPNGRIFFLFTVKTFAVYVIPQIEYKIIIG